MKMKNLLFEVRRMMRARKTILLGLCWIFSSCAVYAQSEDAQPINYGRYLVPTLIGSGVGLVAGGLIGSRVIDEPGSSPVAGLATLAFSAPFYVIGGITGAALFGYDRKKIVLYNTVLHSAIPGALLLSSQYVHGDAFEIAAASYLILTPFITSIISYLLDRSHANNHASIQTFSYVTPIEYSTTIGVRIVF